MGFLIAALLIISLCNTWAAGESGAGINSIEVAKREFQARNFDAALATLNEAESRGGPDAKSLILKGRVYAEQQKYRGSRSRLRCGRYVGIDWPRPPVPRRHAC